MDRWVDGCSDGWVVDGRAHRWMDEWADGRTDGHMDTDIWMDKSIDGDVK